MPNSAGLDRALADFRRAEIDGIRAELAKDRPGGHLAVEQALVDYFAGHHLPDRERSFAAGWDACLAAFRAHVAFRRETGDADAVALGKLEAAIRHVEVGCACTLGADVRDVADGEG